MQKLQYQNPQQLNLRLPFIYFIRVVDNEGVEFRYVGMARNEARLREYVRNISKISLGQPRNQTLGESQPYRAVHFALAKACLEGWDYEFRAIESVVWDMRSSRETHYRSVYRCNLNGARTWRISEYGSLTLRSLIKDA